MIAEKDKEIAELQEQVHDYGLGLYVMQARAEKEARHDKYKRCVAMAERYEVEHKLARYLAYNSNKEIKAYKRWQKWLELAEKFKHNNSTAQ